MDLTSLDMDETIHLSFFLSLFDWLIVDVIFNSIITVDKINWCANIS